MPRVSRSEFADLEGVHRALVTRWIKDGRISPPGPDGLLDLDQARRERAATESPRPQAEARRAQVAAQKAAQQAARERGDTDPAQPPETARAGRLASPVALSGAGAQGPQSERAPAGRSGPLAAPSAAPNGDPDQGQIERVGLGLKLETYKLQKAKAELANLELDQRAGALVERAEVDFVMADVGSTFRGYLEGLPDRLAPVIAGHRGDLASLHKLIEDESREILNQISGHIARRMTDLEKPQ